MASVGISWIVGIMQMLKICKFVKTDFHSGKTNICCAFSSLCPRNIRDLSVSVSAHTESLCSAPQDLRCLALRQSDTTKTPPPLSHLNLDAHSHQWWGPGASEHESTQEVRKKHEVEKQFKMYVKHFLTIFIDWSWALLQSQHVMWKPNLPEPRFSSFTCPTTCCRGSAVNHD